MPLLDGLIIANPTSKVAKGSIDIVADGVILEKANFGHGIKSVIVKDFYVILRPLVSDFTDVNIWNRKLDLDQLQDWTNCK